MQFRFTWVNHASKTFLSLLFVSRFQTQNDLLNHSPSNGHGRFEWQSFFLLDELGYNKPIRWRFPVGLFSSGGDHGRSLVGAWGWDTGPEHWTGMYSPMAPVSCPPDYRLFIRAAELGTEKLVSTISARGMCMCIFIHGTLYTMTFAVCWSLQLSLKRDANSKTQC